MKKAVKLTLVAILFGTLFLTSCSKDDDPTTATPTSSDPRDKFLGSWHVSENSKDYGASTYPCTITDSSDATHILFAPLYNFNKKIYATVNSNTLTIPAQTVQGYIISSSSAVLASSSQINLKYLVKTTSTHYDTIAAVLTK